MADISASAETSWYDGVGHMPFWEDHERFNRELDAFVADLRSTRYEIVPVSPAWRSPLRGKITASAVER
jgi:hypothetical protein